MAPRHTQGVGGRHIVRRRISRAQQTKNWCVGFSFPLPAYAGIHPTLYLFGFRANALNSHSPPYLPGFDLGSGLERFEGALFRAAGTSGVFGGLGGLQRGLPGPPVCGVSASGFCLCPAGTSPHAGTPPRQPGLEALERLEAGGVSSLRGPPRASGRLGRMLGLVVGFASFWGFRLTLPGRPKNISISRSPGGAWPVAPEPRPQARSPGLGLLII